MKLFTLVAVFFSFPIYADENPNAISYRGGLVEPHNIRQKGRQNTDLCEVRFITPLVRVGCGMSRHTIRSVECGADKNKNWALDGGAQTYWLTYKDNTYQLDQRIYQSHHDQFIKGETPPALHKLVGYTGVGTASRVTLARETIRRAQRIWDANQHKVINCNRDNSYSYGSHVLDPNSLIYWREKMRY